MRLIDADEIRKSIRESLDECVKWADEVEESEMYVRVSQSIGTFVECSLRIKNAPTVDAVPMSVIKNIRADIRQIVDEETERSEEWARGLHYALCIIDKHCGKENDAI